MIWVQNKENEIEIEIQIEIEIEIEIEIDFYDICKRFSNIFSELITA